MQHLVIPVSYVAGSCWPRSWIARCPSRGGHGLHWGFIGPLETIDLNAAGVWPMTGNR